MAVALSSSDQDVLERKVNVGPESKAVYSDSQLEKVFEIDPDEETALEQLNKKGWFK